VTAEGVARRPGRAAIRPPKFADRFARLDFDAEALPVISMFEPPEAAATDEASLTLRGRDLRARTVGWAGLLTDLPLVRLEVPVVCQIFNWHETVTWEGLRLRDVLAACSFEGWDDGYLAVTSRDGQYFESLSWDEAQDPRVLLACGLNGQALPRDHGGPVRLVVPFLQGYKSVKWVESVIAYPHDPVGIKRLLGQSKTGRLGQAWLARLAIQPAAGRPGDP
jgi:DMSO/TMAO reductase YedYZ molybdopterin-dependent catalytic subunit